MYLCKQGDEQFVTDAPEAELRLWAQRSGGTLTYSKIEFVHTLSVMYHSPIAHEQRLIREKARKVSRRRHESVFSDTLIDAAIADLFADDVEVA